MPYADVNGIELYYEMEGNGPAVILLTGLGGDARYWKRAGDLLSDRFTVVKIDNRGAGRTLYEGPFTLVDLSNDVIQLMNHLGMERAHVLGWSMGSHIAYNVALNAPDRIATLTLVSSYRYRPARSNYILTSMMDAVGSGMPLEYFGNVLNCLCYTEEFFDEMELEGKTIRAPSIKDLEGLRHQMIAVNMSDLSDREGNISVPAMIIHGKKDIMVDCKEGISLVGRIPGSDLLIIEDAGHHIPAEDYIPATADFMMRHRV